MVTVIIKCDVCVIQRETAQMGEQGQGAVDDDHEMFGHVCNLIAI